MRDNYTAEANRFMYDDNYIVESESSVAKLKVSLEKAKARLTKYRSAKTPDTEMIEKTTRYINKIQNQINHDTAFNVEPHHTKDDIYNAYKAGHRGFKINRMHKNSDDAYDAAHPQLYMGNHGVSTSHHKDKKHITIYAHSKV